MSRKTRTQTREVSEDYRVCDVCKKEITLANAICEVCSRDVHDNTDCSVWDRDREEYVCSVCYALGKAYRDMQERHETEDNSEYAKWREECDAHRYDEPAKGKRS